MVVFGIIGVLIGVFCLAYIIFSVIKIKLKNMNKVHWTITIIWLVLSLVSFGASVYAFNFEPIDAPKSNSSYSSGQKCELCNKKKATRGDYCYDCYETLRGFQKTWG